jgi:hypothetical protein
MRRGNAAIMEMKKENMKKAQEASGKDLLYHY